MTHKPYFEELKTGPPKRDEQLRRQDFETAADRQSVQSAITPLMRQGMYGTAAGLVVLAALGLFAVGGLVLPGGMTLPLWAWAIVLIVGVALVGLGFGRIAEEAARLSREDVEAERAFGDSDRSREAVDDVERTE